MQVRSGVAPGLRLLVPQVARDGQQEKQEQGDPEPARWMAVAHSRNVPRKRWTDQRCPVATAPQAQLRRARLAELPPEEAVSRIADLEIDAGGRVLRRAGEEVHITATEWDLLRVLLRNAGRTLTHHQLFRAVWPGSPGHPQQYLRVFVARLRRKLDDPLRPRVIITQTGVGYRLAAPD
jgi:hypothetical protein